MAYPNNVDFTTFPPSSSIDLNGSIYVGGAADLDPSFTFVSGARAVLEHCARRLISPPGSYDDPDWGFDVNSWLNATLLPRDTDSLAAAVRNEVVDVEGVADADVNVSVDATLGLVIEVDVQMSDADTYPFVFVLGPDTIPRIYFPLETV